MASTVVQLIAAGVLVGFVGTGTALVGGEDISGITEIRVAAFNIQVFGKTKLRKTDVMDTLVQIAQEFDVMVVQEVRDSTETTADEFLARINAESEFTYAMVEGPRLGRSGSKEQYVVYYIPALVEFLHAYTLPDPQDQFEREPLVATFKAGTFDFTLLACHIKPDDASNELQALEGAVAGVLQRNPKEKDIILLGDFNADGSYLAESTLTTIFPSPAYSVLIGNDLVTTTGSANTYDRIVVTSGTKTELVPGTGFVFDYDRLYGITDHGLVVRVSDHYPVYAEFDITKPDDDG